MSEFGRISTLKPRSTLFVAYKTVHRAVMETIDELPTFEVDAMLAFICAGESGPLDQGRYHRIVFERHFMGRRWVWPELEKWRDIAIGLNQWPMKWGEWERVSGAERDALNAKPDEGVNLRRYTLLMSTIYSRASSLEQANRLQNVPRELVLLFETDRIFADIAIAENPDALPPLFPGDMSFMRYRIPGF